MQYGKGLKILPCLHTGARTATQFILKRMTMTAAAQGQQEACPMWHLHTIRVKLFRQTAFQGQAIILTDGTRVRTAQLVMEETIRTVRLSKTLPSYRMVWLHCMHSGNRAVIHLHSIITDPAMQPELSGIQTKRHGQSRLMQV